jgi:alpha-galactosidase
MQTTGIETNHPQASLAAASAEITLRTVSVPSQHLRLIQVEFRDATDVHNELVFEREWLLHTAERQLALSGNLFVIEETLTGAGQIILKALPLPHARPVVSAADLRVAVRPDSGFDFVVVTSDPDETTDTLFIIPYSGGSFGRIRALHACQQALRPGTANHRLPHFLSNTWGDRNRDSRICEAFLLQEIEAGHALGVDVVQIDDGWQRGTTANSVHAQTHGGVWEGYWAADADFWQPHPARLPRGLKPLVDAAAQRGMQIGLWYSPDSWASFTNWERDAAMLLSLHREHGVEHFKIDGVNACDRIGFANLRTMFEHVQRESAGRVVFDLDVTAQVRPGYFGAIASGVIFVENRYTDWHRYWPHQTLRNLWKLARWVDPRRLRMEFLNPTRNTQLYADDPLAPVHYTPDALFATVMCANPLGWFEVSNLPSAFVAQTAPVVHQWRRHRESFFAGTVVPMGNAPDGLAWTGFASVANDGASAYLLIFRECNDADNHTFDLPGLAPRAWRCERLAGQGEAVSEAANRIHVRLPAKLGYLWLRLSA